VLGGKRKRTFSISLYVLLLYLGHCLKVSRLTNIVDTTNVMVPIPIKLIGNIKKKLTPLEDLLHRPQSPETDTNTCSKVFIYLHL